MSNIVLIGMPGAGKSTLGVLLAKALGMSFIDTDLIIQQSEGRLLEEIIDERGIEGFIEVEARTILSLEPQNSIVATGGSVVYSDKAMSHLKKIGRTVYLSLPYEEISGRLGDIKSRGVVVRKGASLRDVYDERVLLYEKYADIVFDCSGLKVEECVNLLVSKLK